jgi:hypothetical protein
VDTVAILHALLFVLLYYERPAIAVRALESVFLAILREQEENSIVMPQLLGYFLPHLSFQAIPLAERVAMLGDQLAQRGFQFFAGFTFTSLNVTPRVVDMAPRRVDEVLRCVREVSPTTDVRIHSRIDHDNGDCSEDVNLSLKKYLSAVVGVCRQYSVRCRQAVGRWKKNGEMLLKLMPNDVDRVMKELHKMLRFDAGYADRFQKLGLWSDILTSEGWVPLQVIDEQLSLLSSSILKDLPSQEKMEIVETLLRQHDNFQRYQVDTCAIAGSAFHGQRCARSVYGHTVRNPPLYCYILCNPKCLLNPGDEGAMESLPLYGWITLSDAPRRVFHGPHGILPLFDKIPFCVVTPAETIGAFRDHDETTSTAKKCDEKLRKPVLYFAEVYLRALARDGAALVLEDESSSVATSSSSPARQQQPGDSVTSRTASSTVSSLRSRSYPPPPPCVTAVPGNMTEVYARVQGEADTKTQ